MHNKNLSDEENYLLTNYQLDCARAWGMTFLVPSNPLPTVRCSKGSRPQMEGNFCTQVTTPGWVRL